MSEAIGDRDGQSLGRQLAARRKRLRLTQREVAERAVLSRPYVTELEGDKRPRPSAETLSGLATALEWPDLPDVAAALAASMASGGAASGGAASGQKVVRKPAERSRPVDVIDGSAAIVLDVPESDRRLVLEFGACGVPCPAEGVVRYRPDDDEQHTVQLPESEDERRMIGPHGYAVRIKGQSMSHWLFKEHDILWVNPDLGKAAGLNRPVLARLMDGTGGDMGMVVKVLRLDEAGKEYLQSDGDEGDNEVKYRQFEFFAVCVLRQPRMEPLVRDVSNTLPSTAAVAERTNMMGRAPNEGGGVRRLS